VNDNISDSRNISGERNVGGDLTTGRDYIGRDQVNIAAPQSGVAALHQLPPAPRDFVGRVAELRELEEQLGAGGATISGLQGMGGVGKTALALVLAHRLLPRYPNAQFFLDLKGVSAQPLRPADVMAHVIRAYHPTAQLPDGEPELAAQYLSVLHGKRALLLLDNAADREQIEPLLPPESCVLLVTSRRHLILPGLHALDLETLPEPDAIALLLKIAPRIGDAAAELAKLCGHLPLSLRLAASALAGRPNLTPQDYCARLQDAQKRLELVEASLSLSYELLSPEHQQRWSQLAVFPATFDTPAAAAVWELEPDAAADTLSEFIAYSLLAWDGTTQRYHLHDLARLFADWQLDDPTRYAAQQRHTAHYLSVCVACDALYLKGEDTILQGLSLFDPIEREWSNIVACAQRGFEAGDLEVPISISNSVRHFFRERGFWTDAEAICRLALLSAKRTRNHEAQTNALNDLGLLFRLRGQWNLSEREHLKALKVARDNDLSEGKGMSLFCLARVAEHRGQYEPAIRDYKHCLEIFKSLGVAHWQAMVMRNLGNTYRKLLEYAAAETMLLESLELSESVRDLVGIKHTLDSLGTTYGCQKRWEESESASLRSLEMRRKSGDRRGEGWVLHHLGILYANWGDVEMAADKYEKAAECLQESLGIRQRIGERVAEGETLFQLMMLCDSQGRFEAAIDYGTQAVQILKPTMARKLLRRAVANVKRLERLLARQNR
jgi:tetratricopeptide (TPR) repeat protein